MWRKLILLAALAAVSLANDFKGHSVLRVVPETEEQLLAVHRYLENNPQLDVWAEPRRPGMPVDVHVSPEDHKGMVIFLEGLGLKHSPFINDLHSLIQKQTSDLRAHHSKLRGDEPIDWQQFYTLEQIYNWLSGLEASYPGVASVISVGKSYEGRDMKGIKIKFGENKPVIMLESGIHAREWIGPASATYFIDQILGSAQRDVVREFEWHIFPCVNPDGYEFTWTKNRNWRKTRSPHMLIFRGVDANRNWPFHWLGDGSSGIAWREDYRGPKAESEVETRNLRAYLDSLADRMHVYLSLHSYSQLLMFPWGYTNDHVANHDQLNAIAGKAAAAILKVNGTSFVYGNIADTIYPASGNTIDYAYSKCVPFPFVFELRDKGRYGFMLPPELILPAVKETWAGINVIVDEVNKSGLPLLNQC